MGDCRIDGIGDLFLSGHVAGHRESTELRRYLLRPLRVAIEHGYRDTVACDPPRYLLTDSSACARDQPDPPVERKHARLQAAGADPFFMSRSYPVAREIAVLWRNHLFEICVCSSGVENHRYGSM
jgi:hypothetical protein